MTARIPMYATIAALLTLAACDESSNGSIQDGGLRAEVTGSVERLVPDDPSSPWVGEEHVRLVDGSHTVICEGDLEVEAYGEKPDSGCAGCEVSLEMLRDWVSDIGGLCTAEDIDGFERSAPSHLAFVRTNAKPGLATGDVLAAESEEGPWKVYGRGTWGHSWLAYRRMVSLEDEDKGEVTVPDLKDPQLPPIDILD